MTFVFTQGNLEKLNQVIKHYPQNKQKSAVLTALDLAQRQCGGWLSKDAIEYVAQILSMPYIRVYEVATFYSMFNLEPVGKYHVQVCTTTPCWLKGSDAVLKACKDTLKIECKEVTQDKLFSLTEVECLGACVNAPVVQINDDYFENLDTDKTIDLINALKNEHSNVK